MDAFLQFANELIWQFLIYAADFFTTIGAALLGIVTSFRDYALLVTAYFPTFSLLQKVLCVLFLLILLAILALLLYKVFLGLKKRVKHKRNLTDQEDLMSEIASLNRQVADLVEEKSKILAMKVSQLGLRPGEEADGGGATITPDGQGETRFPKLAQVDQLFQSPPVVEWNDTITLKDLVDNCRNFAASRMGLYYNHQTIRLFFAGMAASKLLILEGISGTGKTSLPYSVSRFLQNPAGLVSVQPSFRDRAELLGYFNEFTKRFNETEFLRHLYTASYRDDPYFIVLDEMNLARIEYYFAEMLSVLEMPDPSEWTIDLVPVQWPEDPKLLHDGKLTVSTSLWFVGTANNDDSTFTITDKVYDRAMAIDLNQRADAFQAPDTEPIHVTAARLDALFAQARSEYALGEKNVERLEKLDAYLQKRFKLAIGNRISKQMASFVPAYVACGGDESEALDYMIQRKILKKFESLNISYLRDEVGDLIAFIDKTFGKTALPMCKQYLAKLQTMF